MPWKADAERYRSRAVEVRAIAENMTDKATKQVLTGVAKDYERMAQQLEQMREPKLDK